MVPYKSNLLKLCCAANFSSPVKIHSSETQCQHRVHAIPERVRVYNSMRVHLQLGCSASCTPHVQLLLVYYRCVRIKKVHFSSTSASRRCTVSCTPYVLPHSLWDV